MTEESTPLLDELARRFPKSSRTTLRAMLAAGRVCVNGQVARHGNRPIAMDDDVVVADRSSSAPVRATASSLLPLQVIFEDDDLLVVDKPPGLLTSTNAREKRPTALALVRAFYADRPRVKIGLIHRLDRHASGLLVFAKSPTAMASLKAQFFDHSVERSYHAIVHGLPSPPQGKIDLPLVESATGKVFTSRSARNRQSAVTHYETLATKKSGGQERSLLTVELETGRKHQIRAHLATIGHPIVGDPMYGPQPPQTPLMQLRAVRLRLSHPIDGQTRVFAVSGLEVF